MNHYPAAYPPAPLPATALAARQREVENALLVQAFAGANPARRRGHSCNATPPAS
ncbi:MAG: hypothetical protein WKG07_21385 [Hymenobacter sp.]